MTGIHSSFIVRRLENSNGFRRERHTPSPLDSFWSRVDEHLRGRLNPDLYGRWFSALRPLALDGDRLRVAAPDKFHRDFVEDNYRAWFEEFLPALAGRAIRITFAVDDAPRPASAASPPPRR